MDKNLLSEVKDDDYVPVHLAYNCFQPLDSPESYGCPIIFLHGLTSCKETWDNIPQIVANQTKRKTYAYDARNHGDSEWSDDFTIELLVRDHLRFMNMIEAPKAILIGHSMGGTTVINIALKAPDRVEGIIVEDMFVKKPHPSLLSIPHAYTVLAPKAVELLPPEADAHEASKFIMNYVYQSLSPEKQEIQKHNKVDRTTMAVRRNAKGRLELKANMTALEKSIRTVLDTMVDPQGTFDGPACFIYGRRSPFQVACDETIRVCFPRAVMVGLENTWHSIHKDVPQEFVKTVLEYLSTHLPNGIRPLPDHKQE